MEEKKTLKIDDLALNTLIADAALEVVRIAQDWEFGEGASCENPVLEVAAAILRQNRAIKQRNYQNEHIDEPLHIMGRFDLPFAVRHLLRDDLKGADDER